MILYFRRMGHWTQLRAFIYIDMDEKKSLFEQYETRSNKHYHL